MTRQPMIKKKLPKFFDREATDEEKLQFKRALVNYIAHGDGGGKIPQANQDTYIAVLADMAHLDSRWGKVNATNFNTGRYKMHYSFSTTLCNCIRSKVQLKRMIEEALKEAEEESEDEEGEAEMAEADDEEKEAPEPN